MKLSAVEQVEQTRDLVLAELKEHQTPMSLQELGSNLGTETKLSQRALKEAAWGLVEAGKARFNSTWDLEIL
jgi:predicted ArsR family transcriptional regulator